MVCGSPNGLWTTSFKAPAGCGGAVVGDPKDIGQKLPAPDVYFYEYLSPYTSNFNNYRMVGWGKTGYVWHDPKTHVNFQKARAGYAFISLHNRPVPELVPFVPPMSPEPRPDPIPWTELPGRPTPGPGTGVVVDPGMDRPTPAPPDPGIGVPGVPPVVPGVPPGTKPPPTDPNFPDNPPHKFKPPRRGVREVKKRIPAALMSALKAAHLVTEWKDGIDAIWEGVPNHVKAKYEPRGRTRKGSRAPEGTRYYTPDQKAMIIYRHTNEIDWQVALLALAKNGVEDWIMGNMNAGSDKFSKLHLNGNRFVPLP